MLVYQRAFLKGKRLIASTKGLAWKLLSYPSIPDEGHPAPLEVYMKPSYIKSWIYWPHKYGKPTRMHGSQVCACHISWCWSARCRYWPFCWCWRSPCSPLRNTLSRTGAKKTPGDFTTSEATVVNYIVWLCVLLSFWSCYVSTCKTGTFRLETLNCQVLCIVHTCAEWGKLSSWNYFV